MSPEHNKWVPGRGGYGENLCSR